MNQYCAKCSLKESRPEYAMVGNAWTCISDECIHAAACNYIIETAVKKPKAETRIAAPKAEAPAPKAAPKTKKAPAVKSKKP